MTYFFDTYALIEVANGNPRYNAYVENTPIVTTRLNLMELHYAVLRDAGPQRARDAYENFLPYVVGYDDETMMRANQYKYLHARKKLSYIDCIGYTLAMTLGLKFLTGDRQFKDVENVEFTGESS